MCDSELLREYAMFDASYVGGASDCAPVTTKICMNIKISNVSLYKQEA